MIAFEPAVLPALSVAVQVVKMGYSDAFAPLDAPPSPPPPPPAAAAAGSGASAAGAAAATAAWWWQG